jgi:hypothetical protein
VPRRAVDRIKAAIRDGTYDMTIHASEEMAEDDLDLTDVETSILGGKIVKSEKDDPRGTRYTIQGAGNGSTTIVGTVGRFTETGRYLIITVYRVAEA